MALPRAPFRRCSTARTILMRRFAAAMPAAIGRVHARRAGRLQGSLAPSRQSEDLRRVGPAAGRDPCRSSKRAVRHMGGAGRRPRASRQFSAPPARPATPRIVLIDRPGSPQSVIIGGQLTPVDPRSDIVAAEQRQRRARRQLPQPDQHGPARSQGLVLWRQRQSSALQRTCRALSRQRAGPGRPHRRLDHRARIEQIAELPRAEGRHRRGTDADDRQQRQCSFRAGSKPSGAVLRR